MRPAAIYNENEPYAADWLERLIAKELIAPGEVDRRSIRDIGAKEFHATQMHFFAGIGVWSHALRLAGWPDDAEVWTGSCPCQPFSQAGAKAGAADPRHLWPAWFRLIASRRPPIIFGEQVAGPGGLAWFDAVSSDLEAVGYTVGAANLCAGGWGAPHIRQRLYWVAHTREARRPQLGPSRMHGQGEPGDNPARCGPAGGVGDSGGDRDREHPGELPGNEGEHEVGDAEGNHPSVPPGPVGGFWRGAEWLPCQDGKYRPAEPGTFPLADGVTNRVGKLRAYGNALVAPIAAEFIMAAVEAVWGE